MLNFKPSNEFERGLLQMAKLVESTLDRAVDGAYTYTDDDWTCGKVADVVRKMVVMEMKEALK